MCYQKGCAPQVGAAWLASRLSASTLQLAALIVCMPGIAGLQCLALQHQLCRLRIKLTCMRGRLGGETWRARLAGRWRLIGADGTTRCLASCRHAA